MLLLLASTTVEEAKAFDASRCDVLVESYLVDSRNGKVGSTTTTQCERTQSYFDYFNLNAQIRDLIWYGAMPKSSKCRVRRVQ
eukprot:jgi/Psemu1/303579/fgenesh1_kg.112_\